MRCVAGAWRPTQRPNNTVAGGWPSALLRRADGGFPHNGGPSAQANKLHNVAAHGRACAPADCAQRRAAACASNEVLLNILLHDADSDAAADRPGEAGALALIRPLAAPDSGAAQNNLGLMYATAQGVALDPVEALTWYARAAHQGYAPAQYNLG